MTTPFPINLYDRNGATAFTSLNVSSNGNVQGLSANTAFVNATLPDAGMNYLVAPYWDDLRTDQPGGAIWTSTAGVAPDRHRVDGPIEQGFDSLNVSTHCSLAVLAE